MTRRAGLALLLGLVGCGARTTLREPTTAAVPVDVPVAAADAPVAPADVPATGCAATTRSWRRLPAPTTANLTSVFAVAADDVWITAADGTFFRYDGLRWNTVVQLGRESPRALWFASSDDGWALTDSAVMRWDGRRWTVLQPLTVPRPQILSALWGTGPRDVWIGGGMASPQIQILAHYDGAGFATIAPEPLGIQVVGFTATAADDVWAVGHLGRLAHFDGARWSALETPVDGTITACASVARNEVWCAGLRGYAHHVTPTRLETERVGGDETYHYALWHAGDGELWALGYQGAAAHRLHGRWATATIPTDATIAAVHGRCPTDAWAVGERGALLHLAP